MCAPARTCVAILPVFTLLYLFAAFVSPHDPDLGYHLTIGDNLIRLLSFPQRDVFRIDSNVSEIAYSWLPDITLTLAERFGSVLGLRLWIVIGVLILTFVSSLLVVGKRTIGQSAVLLFLLSLAFLQVCNPRPRLIAAILFAALLHVLRADTFENKRNGHAYQAIALFLLVMLWANSHISVFLAPLVIALFGFGGWLQQETWYSLKHTTLLVLGSILAIAFNPYGLSLFHLLYDFSPFQQRAISSRIIELIGFSEFRGSWAIWVLPNLILFALWILVLLIELLNAVRAKLRDKGSNKGILCHLPLDVLGVSFIAAVLAYLSYHSARHAHLFAISAVCAMSCSSNSAKLSTRIFPIIGVILFLFATSVGLSQASWTPKWYDSTLSDGYYPIEALEGIETLLRRPLPAGQRFKILSQFSKGHFISYWLHKFGLGTQAGVILDGRIDALGRSRFFPVLDAYQGICWKDTLAFFAVDVVLVERDDELFDLIDADKDWVAVAGGNIVAFIRRPLIDTSTSRNEIL